MFTVLVSTISNSQVFFAEKVWVAFANVKATHLFSVKILPYMPYLMIKVLTIRYLTTSLVLNNGPWYVKEEEIQISITLPFWMANKMPLLEYQVLTFQSMLWCIYTESLNNRCIHPRTVRNWLRKAGVWVCSPYFSLPWHRHVTCVTWHGWDKCTPPTPNFQWVAGDGSFLLISPFSFIFAQISASCLLMSWVKLCWHWPCGEG